MSQIPAASSSVQATTAQAPPQPSPNPPMTAPLHTAAPPHTFNAGPFGTLAITAVVSGLGLTQSNWVHGDKPTNWDLSNGQIFLQKTTGWWQFYLQAGVYNIPTLGVPFVSTVDTLGDFFGPLPQAYLKLAKGSFSVMAGKLPTLIGAESTFTFEDMNIERGLLLNQENLVSRGVQINDSIGHLTASISWNDGFYSNRYTWLTGTLSYAFSPSNTLAFAGGGNLGETAFISIATPIQNNSDIYDVIYTYSHEKWFIQPYFQYTNVPTNPKAGILRGAATRGAALLLNYNFKHGISLAGRGEYISGAGTTPGAAGQPLQAIPAVNLLYGLGSAAWSFTLTPTYQNHGFFIRGDVSVVQVRNFTAGDAFGQFGRNGRQARGVVEAGFLF